MAKIKLSAIGITALSGTAGGSTFAFNRGGKYVRNWAKPSNPQTAAQQTMRSIFGFVSQLWGTLTPEQVGQWNEAAVEQQRVDVFGDEHTMNGFTYFKAVNQNRMHGGFESPVLTPPEAMPIPAVLSTQFVWSDDPSDVDNVLAYKLGEAVGSGDYYASIGFAVVPANQKRSYGSVKNKFGNRVRMAVPAGASIDATAEVKSFMDSVPAGSRVFVQMHIHSASGQKGPEVVADTYVTEA